MTERSLIEVGDQVRLIPDFPVGSKPLRWQTVTSLSTSFAGLEGHIVSRRVLEQYIAEGRIEVRSAADGAADELSWLLAQAAACMVGMGFRDLSAAADRAEAVR